MCKNKNWDIDRVVKWVDRIDKVVFEDVKYRLVCIPGC